MSENKDFKRVFKLGEKTASSFLVLRRGRNNLDLNRFGFVVSNKISNKSVQRHLIKRRLQESTRSRLKIIKPGYDCVILVTPEIREKSYQKIDEAMEKLLRKAGLT